MSNYSKSKIKGATMIEYVLIAGLIAIAAVVAVTGVGTKLSTTFTNISTQIPTAS